MQLGSDDTITVAAQQTKAAVVETIDHTKGSLAQALHKTEHVSSVISNTMQTAIASSVSHWLQSHPAVSRLLEMLIWASNHPIISLAILLLAIAIAWQLIKALGYLMEVVGRSILQAPVILLQFLFGVTAKSVSQLGNLAVQQFVVTKNTELPALPPATSQPIQPDKQQRLAEISSRLEAIQKEQNELLQEVAAIMASDKVNIKT